MTGAIQSIHGGKALTDFVVAMATYNGAAYLPEQLASIAAQQGVRTHLWVSDDGSDDGTLDLLHGFQADRAGDVDVTIVEGPRRGAAANFLSLLCRPDFPTDHLVALSDQDDVWRPHKLSRAAEAMASVPGACLYGARASVVDQSLAPTGRLTNLPKRPPAFPTALTQNVVAGFTAVLNPAALAIVRQARAGEADVPFHDWWLYQLISGAGGQVIVDDADVALYRQHDSNVLGMSQGSGGAIRRAVGLLDGEYGDWVARNLRALDRANDVLTPEARAVLHAVQAAPKGGLARLRQLRALGLHRQGRVGDLAFATAALLGRV